MNIIGVHPVNAPEPCHLIEVAISSGEAVDWSGITQKVSEQPRDNWQTPWDEQPLDDSGSKWVFFFHYLDITKSLITQNGSLDLPEITPIPAHLLTIRYEEP